MPTYSSTSVNNDVYTNNIERRKMGQGLWSGVFAGFFIALLAFWIILTLGVAIGGHALSGIGRDELDGLGMGAAIWTFVSAVLGCFIGGYYCSRIVSYASWRAGVAEGLIVSSLFFLALSLYSGGGIGLAGKGVANLTSMSVGSVASLADRPEVGSILQRGLGDVQLKSEPQTVITQLGTYLVRGDREAATNYLAYQTGQTRAEVDARINSMTTSVNQAIDEIKDKAGAAVASVGWFTFITALIGSLLCCLGAGMGARQNATLPLTSTTANPYPV